MEQQAQNSGVPGDETFEQRIERMTPAEMGIKPLRPWHRAWWQWKHAMLRLAIRKWLGVHNNTRITVEHHRLIEGLRADHDAAVASLNLTNRATITTIGSLAGEVNQLEQHLGLRRRYTSATTYTLERMPRAQRRRRR